MLDLQAEQHDRGQSCTDLYEAVLQLKRRHDLHPCAVRPRDGLALRRDSEREIVQDLVKRYRELPIEQQRRMPALLNSLAQLEIVVGDLESSQHDFQEVARLVGDPIARAEAHHNVYRAALERRDWSEALAALRRAAALDSDDFEPFPFARYEPERLLGGGGFGVSFLCRQRSNGRRVVVKALRPDSLDRDVATLFRDMNSLQDLDNPALARIHDCGCAGDEGARPYLVLEHVEGQTLAEHVAQHGPLAAEDWLSVIWPLARALQALHGRGILHRSLRPAAVLLTPVADAPSSERPAIRWRVKLLDTGLSLKRALIHAYASNPDACARTTLGRSVARTIAFVPVEVVGRPKGQVWIGPHSDIYSFGKVCAFALTGRADLGDADSAHLPEAWRQLLADCTAWTIGARPAHLGLVIDRLSQLPEAGERIRLIEQDLHEITIAEHTAALESDPQQVALVVSRGNAYSRQGDFANAVADYTKAIQLQPGSAELYRRRAFIHTRSRALDDAIADFTEALRLEPRNIEAHANRGLAYAQKNDFDRALADYNEALRLNPRDPVLLLNRGNTYYAKRNWALALADYTEVIRLDPHNLWAHGNRGKVHALLGDYYRAAADFTRILQLDAHNVRALCDRAAAYSGLHQLERAIADYTTALALEPSAALYNERGLAHAALDDFDAAIADFGEAIALEPNFAVSYLLRGDAHADKGDLEKARADYEEAIRLDPAAAAGYFHRGNLHCRCGSFTEAVADYNRVLELQPDHPAALFQRGNIHAQNGQWEAAIADYSAALRIAPNDTASLTNRGNAYSSLGDHERALADYSTTLTIDPADVLTLCNRAGAYARQGDSDRALADYTEALRYDPANVRALGSRGSIHAERGDFESALADFTAALRLEPNSVILYHNRGRIHSLLGNYEQAIADNSEALRLQPDNAATCNNLAWLWAMNPCGEQRDPARAIEFARRACEQTQWQIAGFIDTLAAALASAGQFAEAVEQQRRAVELASADEKAEYRVRLELYESGRVYELPAEPQ
jgi:tetratricopeptide (TPR) repeat protein